MRLTCSQKDLATALNITNKAVSPNNTLPVLNNVLLRAEGKRLYFTTTNLEIAISYWIETQVKNEGEITIPSRLFTNYISYLKDEKLDLAAEEGTVLLIKNSDSTTKIKGIPAAEFPPIPTVEREGELVLGAADLKKAIQQVVFAASLNSTRPILGGVYFYLDKDRLVLVATDSYRLAEKSVALEKSSGTVHCIVPARTLIELGNVLEAAEKVKTVEITVSKNQILFTIGEIKMVSRLIEGQFPNYKQIIPKQSKTKVIFDPHAFSQDLKRINLFAKENNNKVIFRIKKDGVTLTTDTTQYGEGEVHITARVEGVGGEIALNSQYILDVLSNLGSGELLFEISEKANPVILRPQASTDYIHIIMPLKI